MNAPDEALRPDRSHGAHQLGLDGQLAVHGGARRVLVDGALLARDRRLEDQLVARLHHALEARAVDAGEVVQARAVRLLAFRRERQQRRGLGQRLQHQHARHHRTVREVPVEERLVDRDVLQRLDAHVLLELEHAVDEQERIAVRQLLDDLVDVHQHGSLILSLRAFFSRAGRARAGRTGCAA
jgi:methylaspartate ammonia-lyase